MHTALLVTFVAFGMLLLPAFVAVATLLNYPPPDLRLPAAPVEAALLARWLATPILALALRTDRSA